MRGRFLFLVIVSLVIWSCEDPTTLPASRVFTNNKLQSVYVDTFTVITSTVQLDSFLTNNSGTVLLGKYNDEQLGTVASSSYFQICYPVIFQPDIKYIFDSAVLYLPYNHTFSGDTTKPVTLNVYQLTEQVVPRKLPDVSPNSLKLSVYNNSSSGFFNTTTLKRAPIPLGSKTVKFSPHRDSVTIRLSDATFKKMFTLAQPKVLQFGEQDSSALFFTSIKNFVTQYFYGLNIDVDPSTDACVAGFDASRVKLRFYYKKLVEDHLIETHSDFQIVTADEQGVVNIRYATLNQFNHISYDRSGTPYFSSLQKLKPVLTTNTGNMGFIQSGTGLVMRLDFPSLRDFFSINNGVILNAAFLELHPIRGSYPKNFLAIPGLQLYGTDASNLPTSPIQGGFANIHYDYEFGADTYYSYPLFSYINSQIWSNSVNTIIKPIIIGPAGNQGGSVQRVYLGDRFFVSYPQTKIKLKLFYSYVLK